MSRREEALAASEQATAFSPQNGSAWVGRGAALLGMGRTEEALAALEQAVTLGVKDAVAWYAKGLALKDLHHLKQPWQLSNKRSRSTRRTCLPGLLPAKCCATSNARRRH